MANELASIIDDSVKVNAAAAAALKEFRRSKPWRGTFAERLAKLEAFHAAMSEAYGLSFKLTARDEGDVCSGGSEVLPLRRTIALRGRLSVVTYLHLLGRARGMSRTDAIRWSVNVFRKFFPLSFSRCQFSGGMLVKTH